MNKASKPGVGKKPVQMRLGQKQTSTKLAKSKKARGGAVLAEVVAQMAVSAEKLAQAAERLADAATQLSVNAEARQESVQTRSQLAADSATPQAQFEATAATEDEQPSTEQEHAAGQGGLPTIDS